MKTGWKLCAAVFLAWFLTMVSAHAGDINLSAAASTKDAMREIIEGFAKAHPGTTVLTNFGASGTLAKQIVHGAPADVYVSANEKWLDYVVQQGRADRKSRECVIYNNLVFVGRKGLAVASLADLKTLTRIAIGTPASVPAGQYAKQAMSNAGVYEELEADRKLVMAQDVRQALLYADRNEVDGAFVYRTDAMLAREAGILFVVPAGLYDRVSYPMVLTVAGNEKSEAKAFYEYLDGPEARKVFQKFGFETAR